jgi:hypothetical protein
MTVSDYFNSGKWPQLLIQVSCMASTLPIFLTKIQFNPPLLRYAAIKENTVRGCDVDPVIRPWSWWSFSWPTQQESLLYATDKCPAPQAISGGRGTEEPVAEVVGDEVVVVMLLCFCNYNCHCRNFTTACAECMIPEDEYSTTNRFFTFSTSVWS